MGFIRLIFASVFTEIYVRKLSSLDETVLNSAKEMFTHLLHNKNKNSFLEEEKEKQ